MRSAVELLLAADPGTAAARDGMGWTPLHRAAHAGHDATVKQLLAVAPLTAAARNGMGWTPLHHAAWAGHSSLVELLLAAAPDTAAARTLLDRIPLHDAGSPAVAQALIAAGGPQACTIKDYAGWTPFETAIHSRRIAVAACLLQAVLAPQALSLLAAAGNLGRYYYADLVMAHPNLSSEQWAQLPTTCPGLGLALPAALAHSTEAARQLVAHLIPTDRQRLHAFTHTLLLFVAHMQRHTGVYLPASLVGHILSMFDS